MSARGTEDPPPDARPAVDPGDLDGHPVPPPAAGPDAAAPPVDTTGRGAPPVVAVVVTRDPGPWFEECLGSLAAQDYGELSVLVLVSGGREDPTSTVAAVLPDAFVRKLPEDRGFGAAADEVLGMVEGAAFYLFCHDDAAPDPDAVHLMVEESFRSNAGIVTPKMVRWDDPTALVHVGMTADKTGAVTERIQPGEVDHGQHDAVRDVFVAPGGFTLVRADLFAEIAGFDPAVVAMGEDLDLSWRAQVAGARIVVAPAARVRHLELVAAGDRPVAAPDGAPPPNLQALQRRHELRAVLVCYSPLHRLRVLPQAALLNLGEAVVAVVGRNPSRAGAVLGAWRWNFAHRREIRQRRKLVGAHRAVPDTSVRRLQVAGSARLSTYVSRLTHQGFEAAQGQVPATGETADADGPVLTGSVGLAFSEDADFDELDDLGHRSGRDRFGRRIRRPPFTRRRARFLAWLVAAAVLVIGTRDLIGARFPVIGQLLPPLGWSATWSHLFAPWQSPGVGTTAPVSSAFAVMGTLGTVLLGAMGLAQKVLVLGCIPLGAVGASRLVRPFASPRAQLAAGLAYLGLPLAYNSLAQGRLDGLVAFALVPWMLGSLARASGAAPYARAVPGWRGTLGGQMVTLGALEAVAVALAPAVAPTVLVCGIGVWVGSLLVGDHAARWRVLAVAGGATGVAFLLLFPWTVGTLLAGRGAIGVFGLPTAPSQSVPWTSLLRFSVGPVGGSVLSWLLPLAAVLPLAIARRTRLAWAARLWSVACLSWLLALLVTRGWAGSFAPPVQVLLAPAAAALAGAIGLGVAAFENDLAGFRFGWRQVAGAAAVVVATVGVLPVVAEAGDGRWGLPSVGYGGPLGFLASPRGSTGYRIMWLASPRAMPLGGWEMEPGVAYATTVAATPDATVAWPPAGPGPAAQLPAGVALAAAGRTSHLGRLLAPAGVRYVVVTQNLAPTLDGLQATPAFPVPPQLIAALEAQSDLRQVQTGSQGLYVFVNTEALPLRATRRFGVPAGTAGGTPGAAAIGAPAGTVWPRPADVAGWRPTLPVSNGSDQFTGPVTPGTLYGSYAPGGDWQLRVGGRTEPADPAFGWAAQYQVGAPGAGVLSFTGGPLVPLAVALQMVVWLVLLGALYVRPEAAGRLGGRLTRRTAPDGPPDGDGPEPEADPTPATPATVGSGGPGSPAAAP